MFQSLFRRAEATVDQAVTGLVIKVLVAIPFLVAFGFATAAATMYVNRAFGTEAGYLVMAGAFLVIGALAAVVAAPRNGAPLSPAENMNGTSTSPCTAVGSDEPALDKSDREILMAALTALGPVAAPTLVRLVVRNLPLVAALAAAGFVLTRPTKENVGINLGAEAAE